ncbi:MAG TPA: hypothetical protein DD379_10290 [Cyanobacteria bacterium UBA11162]|nr:hypothetical protein [Cyanobacteria bacterium UBA11162]
MKTWETTGLLCSTAFWLLSSCLTQQSTSAQTICEPDGNYEPPSSAYKTIELENFGISVDIPDNYRAMKRQDGSVEILHPDDYQWIQCIVNGGSGGGGYYSETIRLVEDDMTLNLREQAIELLGDSLNPNANQILTYENNGISGYIVTYISDYSVSFLGIIPGQSKLLEVTASCDCQVEVQDVTEVLNRIRVLR